MADPFVKLAPFLEGDILFAVSIGHPFQQVAPRAGVGGPAEESGGGDARHCPLQTDSGLPSRSAPPTRAPASEQVEQVVVLAEVDEWMRARAFPCPDALPLTEQIAQSGCLC